MSGPGSSGDAELSGSTRDAELSGSSRDAELPGSDRVHVSLRAEIRRARERRPGLVVRVLDVGGGSGVWAVPIAAAGCQVTVVDTSPNALAALRARATQAGVAGRIAAIQGDAHALGDVVPAAGADLVLGHGLLEVVDDVTAVVAQLAEAVAPEGAVSVLTAGRYGAALGLVHAGRFAQARAILTDPAGRSGPTDPLQRRWEPATLREMLESVRLSVTEVQGDGVFEGWLPGAGLDAAAGGATAAGRGPATGSAHGSGCGGRASGGAARELVELANLAAATPELLVLAARLHVLASRPRPALPNAPGP